MTPPDEINVLDRHRGFTIETEMPHYLRCRPLDMTCRRQLPDHAFRPSVNSATKQAVRDRAKEHLLIGDTRSGVTRTHIDSPIGTLLDYDERSFYQNNDDVTLAVYRVRGYSYPVLVWFDNQTGERIA